MKIHIVRPADTLWKIARKYKVPLQTLIDLNAQIKDPDQLETGMKVRIPTGAVPVTSSKKEAQPSEMKPPKLPHLPESPEREMPKRPPQSKNPETHPPYPGMSPSPKRVRRESSQRPDRKREMDSAPLMPPMPYPPSYRPGTLPGMHSMPGYPQVPPTPGYAPGFLPVPPMPVYPQMPMRGYPQAPQTSGVAPDVPSQETHGGDQGDPGKSSGGFKNPRPFRPSRSNPDWRPDFYGAGAPYGGPPYPGAPSGPIPGYWMGGNLPNTPPGASYRSPFSGIGSIPDWTPPEDRESSSGES